MCERGERSNLMEKKESPPSITRNPNWSLEIYGKGSIMLKKRYYHP
jgi:hypothetical protein